MHKTLENSDLLKTISVLGASFWDFVHQPEFQVTSIFSGRIYNVAGSTWSKEDRMREPT